MRARRTSSALAAAVAALSWGLAQRVATADVDSFHEKVQPVYVPQFRHPPKPLFGLDFGLGTYDGFCGQCRSVGAVALGVYGGMLVLDQVAVVVDAQSLIHLLPAGQGVDADNFAQLALQVWPTPVLWLRGGFGAGLFIHQTSGPNAGPDVDALAPAAELAFGGEVLQRPSRGIDLAGCLELSDFDLAGQRVTLFSVAATIGFHWL